MPLPSCVPDLVDIGANLTHESFDTDRDAVISRAVQAGVKRMMVTGADLASSQSAARLAAGAPGRLWSTAGVHPHHAQRFDTAQRAQFVELLEQQAVVAVGECGLDYYRNLSSEAAQRAAFIVQLEMAAQLNKPVFLHQRDAHDDFMSILKDFGRSSIAGVAHCFTGGRRELDDYLSLGLSIGVTGWVCDERRGSALRDAVPHIPRDSLMIETDAPYLLPRDLKTPVKTRRNEPGFLPHIAAAVGRLRGESLEEVAAVTTANAQRLFGL